MEQPFFLPRHEINTQHIQEENRPEIFISAGKPIGLLGNSVGEDNVDPKGNEDEACSGEG